MLRTNTKHHAYVESPNGQLRGVKNLGWLLRNWSRIERLVWTDQKPREGYPMTPDGLFSAVMRDGRIYRTEYASFEVWKGFIDRPVFRGLPVVVNGIEGTV